MCGVHKVRKITEERMPLIYSRQGDVRERRAAQKLHVELRLSINTPGNNNNKSGSLHTTTRGFSNDHFYHDRK